MQLDRDDADGNFIRNYSRGELLVAGRRYTEPVIVTTATVLTGWNPPAVGLMSIADLATALDTKPELILLGTGATQQFPSPQLMAAVLRQGVGLEVMDTAAACRTYNVLAAEGRAVVAALLL